MIRIILDCCGGDHCPDAPVEGAIKALQDHPDLTLILTGDEAVLSQKLVEYKNTEKTVVLTNEEIASEAFDTEEFWTSKEARLFIVHAPEVVGCDEKPTDAIRLKKESSLMKAIYLLREHEILGGMVSTGSTGALIAAAMLRIGRIPGVIRPAFCPILPTMNGGIVGICDSGANVDITPDYFPQYAKMASLYLEHVYGVKNPRCGLVNIGTEAEKGDDLRKTAYPLLQQTKGINFVGNMEARELLSGDFDIALCDAFAGNVLIKSTEGTSLELLKKLKKDIASRFIYKLGGLLMYKMFMDEKKFMNYQNYGGSVLLGTKRTIVKSHGSSKATAIVKSIEQAYHMESASLNAKIEEALKD